MNWVLANVLGIIEREWNDDECRYVWVSTGFEKTDVQILPSLTNTFMSRNSTFDLEYDDVNRMVDHIPD